MRLFGETLYLYSVFMNPILSRYLHNERRYVLNAASDSSHNFISSNNCSRRPERKLGIKICSMNTSLSHLRTKKRIRSYLRCS